MATNFNLLGKGLIRLAILLFLFIVSPIILTIGFKALDKYSATPKIYVGYLILLAGSILILYSIYFAFKTFKVLQNSIFNNK